MTDIFDTLLEKIEQDKAVKQTPQHGDGGHLDVERYLNDHHRKVVKVKPNGDGTLYCLEHCVFDDGHAFNEAAICQTTEGKTTYQCFHDGCKGKTWKDARDRISGAVSLKQWMTGGNGHQKTATNDARPRSNAPDMGMKSVGDVGEIQRENKVDAGDIDPHRFEFTHNADITKNLKPTQWRIKGILPDYSFYINVGRYGTYKTFIELDRLLCIASGIAYHGHEVKQGTVFYIAGEGQQGIGRRIAAWHIAHGTKAEDVPFFISRTPTQLMDLEAVQNVRRTIDEMAKEYGPPAATSFDTLARNFGDGDENSTRDMNKLVSNLDRVFKNEFCRGATHHTGWANEGRSRGSIVLPGAIDVEFIVTINPTGQIVVTCKKMKDNTEAAAMVFNRRIIPLLIEGVEDSSCVLELAAEGEEAILISKPKDQTKLKAGLWKSLEILRNLYKRYNEQLKKSRINNSPNVMYSDWRAACMDAGLYKRTDTFARAAEQIHLAGYVEYDRTKKFVYLKEMSMENED
jgi:hypothetical protein